jgi:citrate lyase subunit beta / citryl-CoA lyase
VSNNKIATAGNKGDRVRSDCFATLELKETGGLTINLTSKVAGMFGAEIKQLSEDILNHFEIKNAELTLEDSGALPFVQAARIEAAVRKITGTEKEFLLELIEENKYTSKKDQFRFSRLYLPGNSPSMMLNAGLHDPNGIILDLEDSVAFERKNEARLLVRNALRSVNFYGAERMVRINQGDMGIEDLKYVIPHNVHMLLVPKCEDASYILKLEEEIEKIKKAKNIERPIYLMPIVESALGVEMAFEIAKASENVVAMAIGLEDFTADLGVRRTNEATESFFARTRLVNACKAARIQPIDSVFSDVSDMDALRETVKVSKSLGFEGMGCIHPRQIPVIHDSFAPEEVEIVKAKKIVNAFIDATERGLGVVSLGSKMIDPPVVKRAETTINLAINLGIISKKWREEEYGN